MVNVNTFKVFTETLANIDQTGANFTAVQFNAVLPEAHIDLIRQYFGKPKWRQVQPYLTNERDQSIKDYLSNSEIHVLKDILPVNGVIALPDDYMHLMAIRYAYTTKRQRVCIHCGSIRCICPSELPRGFRLGLPAGCVVKDETVTKQADVTIVNSSQWANVMSDPLLYPDMGNPYGQYIGDNAIEIAPQNIPKVRVDYLRYPKVAVWGSVPVNGFAQYNPLTSQHIEIPRVLTTELAAIVLEAMGFATREYWMEQVKRREVVTDT